MANINLTGTPTTFYRATNGKKKKKMDRDQKELDDAKAVRRETTGKRKRNYK